MHSQCCLLCTIDAAVGTSLVLPLYFHTMFVSMCY